MVLRGRPSLFVACLVLALLASEARARAAAAAGFAVPLITSATADLDAGTLTIVGQDFVSSPLPRVHMGTEAGGLHELLLDSANSTSIVARLIATSPGTYRVVVLFGRTGLLDRSRWTSRSGRQGGRVTKGIQGTRETRGQGGHGRAGSGPRSGCHRRAVREGPRRQPLFGQPERHGGSQRSRIHRRPAVGGRPRDSLATDRV